MRSMHYWIVSIACLLASSTFAANKCDESSIYIPGCEKRLCCGDMGGISYCDSSAGRYVCSNGYFSSCYCTRHAVMDLQKIQGCCLWQGGVLTADEATGMIICNNGTVSESCSLEFMPQQGISIW